MLLAEGEELGIERKGLEKREAELENEEEIVRD